MIRDIQGDAEAAEREYELAIALGPSYAPAHHWHAFGLEARGHHAEAMEEIRTAYALDPLSVAIGNAYGGFSTSTATGPTPSTCWRKPCSARRNLSRWS